MVLSQTMRFESSANLCFQRTDGVATHHPLGFGNDNI